MTVFLKCAAINTLIFTNNIQGFSVNISTDRINATRQVITVTVPLEIIKDEAAKLIQETVQKVRLPGFRPGKVPVQMLKTKFAKELNAELKDKVIIAAHKYLMDNAGVNIYAINKLDVQGDQVSEDNEAVLIFTVDVKPQFDLPNYIDIPVTVPAVEVSDEEVERAFRQVLKEFADYNSTDEAAQKGDYVKLSYEGKIDGQPITELLPRKTIYGTQNSTWEEAGAENVPGVPAVIEGIVGMKAGEQKTVIMHFPKDFQIPELADKKATYDLSVEEVRRLDLPEIDEALFKKLNIENTDHLRREIKTKITQEKENISGNQVMNKVIEYLLNSVVCDVPESAIKDEEAALVRLYVKRMYGRGLTEAQIEEQKDEIFAAAQHEAIGRAKLHMILDAIARKENMQIDEQDLNRRVMIDSYNLGMKPQKFVNDLKKDRNAIEEFRQQTLFHKILDFLCKKSKVEYKGGVSESS